MRQLTDETLPTMEEARLLAERHDQIVPCRKRAYEQMMVVAPGIANALLNGWTEWDANLAQLVERKITWAQATRRSQDIGAQTRAEARAADQQITGELRAEHEAELDRRQQAAEALMQWSAQQQMINSLNRPTFTTCNAMGTFVNCMSH